MPDHGERHGMAQQLVGESCRGGSERAGERAHGVFQVGAEITSGVGGGGTMVQGRRGELQRSRAEELAGEACMIRERRG